MPKHSEERQAAELGKLLRELARDLEAGILATNLPAPFKKARDLATALDRGHKVTRGVYAKDDPAVQYFKKRGVDFTGAPFVGDSFNPMPPDPQSARVRKVCELLWQFQDRATRGNVVPGPVPPTVKEDIAKLLTLADSLDGGKAKDAPGKEKAGGAAPASKWQDIQHKLLKLYRQGEPYTSGRVLGRRVGCSAGTIGKAVKHSPDLRKWKAQKTKGRPKAQSLTAPVVESIASDADDPANTLPDDEVDKTMKMLIACAKPAERPKLVALDKDARRRLAEAASEHSQDLFNEDHAPKGNRILGRKS